MTSVPSAGKPGTSVPVPSLPHPAQGSAVPPPFTPAPPPHRTPPGPSDSSRRSAARDADCPGGGSDRAVDAFVFMPDVFGRGDGEEGEGSEGDGTLEKSGGLNASDGELDLDMLAEEIAPAGADDGIFEVTLPNGQKIGVAISVQASSTQIHLSAADETLGERLRRRRMELKGHLERRMQRNVDVTVL